MSSTATEPTSALVPARDKGAIQLVIDLEQSKALTPVSLDLTDPDMTLDSWLSLGRLFGQIGRAVNWWVGDWINFGEAVYGEESAQGVDTIQDRYNDAERITGFDHGTLLNISSICRKVAKKRRRKELGFWIHAEVAPLEPDEQKEWLARAIKENWNRGELRQAIKDAKNPPSEDEETIEPPAGDPGLTIGERIEQAARLVYHQAQAVDGASYMVAAEYIAQLGAALGEG